MPDLALVSLEDSAVAGGPMWLRATAVGSAAEGILVVVTWAAASVADLVVPAPVTWAAAFVEVSAVAVEVAGTVASATVADVADGLLGAARSA